MCGGVTVVSETDVCVKILVTDEKVKNKYTRGSRLNEFIADGVFSR